jgi:hypothetical protein
LNLRTVAGKVCKCAVQSGCARLTYLQSPQATAHVARMRRFTGWGAEQWDGGVYYPQYSTYGCAWQNALWRAQSPSWHARPQYMATPHPPHARTTFTATSKSPSMALLWCTSHPQHRRMMKTSRMVAPSVSVARLAEGEGDAACLHARWQVGGGMLDGPMAASICVCAVEARRGAHRDHTPFRMKLVNVLSPCGTL